MEGNEGDDIRMIALCADCGCPMIQPHDEFPVLCRPCGDGMAALIREQRRVLKGERTDWPGECHVDAQCGPWSEQRERQAVTMLEFLTHMWDTWRWWFEGDCGDGGVAA